jgi:hypothetical protein
MADERCWYCDQLGVVDHKHGEGASCGDCCATHGALTEDMEVYNWVKDCIAAKNAHIAELEAHLAEAKKQREAWLALNAAVAACRTAPAEKP